MFVAARKAERPRREVLDATAAGIANTEHERWCTSGRRKQKRSVKCEGECLSMLTPTRGHGDASVWRVIIFGCLLNTYRAVREIAMCEHDKPDQFGLAGLSADRVNGI